MNDAVKLTPIPYRLMAEATEKLRNQVIASGHAEMELWLAIAHGELLNLLLAGTVIACVEMDDGRLARIAPVSWRPVSSDAFSRVAMTGLAPIDYRWESLRDRPLLLTDTDFERVVSVSRMLPTVAKKSPPKPRHSPEAKIIRVAADYWRRNPDATKGEVLAVVQSVPLACTANAWEEKLFRPARIAAGLPEQGKVGAPKKSRGSKPQG